MRFSREQFRASCHALNEVMKNCQEKEVVSDETAARAMIIIKNMKVNKIGDAFLYAAALNVMNTFVKQTKENKKNIGYFFKRNTDLIARYLLEHPDDDVRLEIQMDQGMTLMVAEMFGIQFSFHQVVITQNNEKYRAKDENHLAIPWDGIRKQMCANTLFDFAYSQDFERTNVMIDGTPLQEGIDKLLKDLQEKKIALVDLKHAVFVVHKEGEDQDAPKREKREFNDLRTINANAHCYKFRNQPIGTLYEGTMKEFVKAICDRTLVKYLASQFEDGYGEKISDLKWYVWKYLFSTILDIIDGVNCNPDCGVRVDYVRNKLQDTISILFASMDENGKVNASVIQMVDWAEATPSAERDAVNYRDKDTGNMAMGVHPSLMATEYLANLTHSIVDEESFIFKAATYLFDAADEEQVTISKPGDRPHRCPVYYAGQIEEVKQFIIPAVSAGDGLKALRGIRKLTSINRDKRGLTEDQDYALTTALKLMDSNQPFLMTIDGRCGSGKKTITTVMAEIMEKRKQKLEVVGSGSEDKNPTADMVVFMNYIPEEIDYEAHRGNILFYDPFLTTREEFDNVIRLRSEASGNGIKQHRLTLYNCPGYVDDGAGNNWLIRHLQIGIINKQIWNPANYRIELVNSPDEFTDEEGIANITIGDEVHYDPQTKGVTLEWEDKIRLYSAFTYGKKGVRIYASDPAFRTYIQDEINSEINRYKWLKDFKGDYSGDYDKLAEAQKELLDNSVIRNKYERYLISNVGENNWNKLLDECQNWMLSAMLTYNDIRNYDQTMDFSGVVIQISKTFERESVIRFSLKYIDYLKRKYGDEFLDHVPEVLTKVKYDGTKVLGKTNEVMLGSISYVAGIKRDQVSNRQEYDEFIAYCKDELMADKEHAEESLFAVLRIIDYVRSHYRNVSAHSGEFLPATLALDCVQYVITEKHMFKQMFDYFAF